MQKGTAQQVWPALLHRSVSPGQTPPFGAGESKQLILAGESLDCSRRFLFQSTVKVLFSADLPGAHGLSGIGCKRREAGAPAWGPGFSGAAHGPRQAGLFLRAKAAGELRSGPAGLRPEPLRPLARNVLSWLCVKSHAGSARRKYGPRGLSAACRRRHRPAMGHGRNFKTVLAGEHRETPGRLTLPESWSTTRPDAELPRPLAIKRTQLAVCKNCVQVQPAENMGHAAGRRTPAAFGHKTYSVSGVKPARRPARDCVPLRRCPKAPRACTHPGQTAGAEEPCPAAGHHGRAHRFILPARPSVSHETSAENPAPAQLSRKMKRFLQNKNRQKRLYLVCKSCYNIKNH